MKKYLISLVKNVWSKLTLYRQRNVEVKDEQPDVMRRMVLAGAVATVVVGLLGTTMLSNPAEAQHYRRRSRRWRRRRRRHYRRRSRRRHYYRRSRRRRHYYRRSRRRRHYYRRSRRRHYYGRSRRRRHYYGRSRHSSRRSRRY